MVISSPTPTFLEGYWQDGFRLEQHLQEFLKLDAATITEKLQNCRYDLENLGNTDFDWEEATAFYKDKVGEMYLFKLGTWHLESQDYIGGTIKLIADQAKGRVLDFGGGIGTHAIATAMCPNVDSVIYCDINPINRGFVEHRVAQLGLSHKISFRSEIPLEEALEGYFDTVLCFDVLEHLPDPSGQLMQFHKMLSPQGKIIVNWYFFKGFENEHPIHLDDPETVDTFFRTLQANFLEVFQPHLITARCYRKFN